MTLDEATQVFMMLFRRVYGVEFAPKAQSAIAFQIQESLANDDLSGRQLIDYAVSVAAELAALPPPRLDSAKAELRGVFTRAYSRHESNERARILATVFQELEQARPGSTGVATTWRPSPFRKMPDRPVIPWAPPPTALSPVAPAMTPEEDPAAQQRRAQREMEQAALKSNIERMKHEMNMAIINNIKS